nr:low-temperature-induced cysteine proteinase-like [Tanacetum cinerariifolium]
TNSLCGGGPSCRKGQTCCHAVGTKYGCCPYRNAVCCKGTKYCCPSGTTCNVKAGKCIRHVSDASGVVTTNYEPAELKIRQQTAYEETPVENQPPN